MQLFANNADSSLNGALAPDTAVLVLKAGEGDKFPSPTNGDFFLVTLFQRVGTAELNHEIVKCTSRVDDVLTVTRAQEGTSAKNFPNGACVELRVTAGTLNNKVEKVEGKSLSTEDFTTAEKTKLGGIASGATANSSDAFLKNRANHTGTQAIETIEGLDSVLGTKVSDAPSDGKTYGRKDAAWAEAVTPAGTQTLTNKTLTGYTETVYNLTGTVIAVANGSIQTKTLSANTTFTESLADGQSVILGITAGAFSITWPSVTWTKVGGSGVAPTLTSSGVNWIILWQVGGVVRGSFMGTA